MNRQINLLYGHPDIYQPVQVERSNGKLKWVVRLLAILLVAETALLGYIFWLPLDFDRISQPVNLVKQFSLHDPFKNFNLTWPNWNQKGDILGASTNVPYSSPTLTPPPSASPTPSLSADPSLSPGPIVASYTVKSGDNWWQIVRKVCGTRNVNKDVVDFNLTKNEPTLHSGDKVNVYCTIP